MRRLPYLFAVAAVGGLALASASSAGPLVGGLAFERSTFTELSDRNVQKVHRWHCDRRKGWYKGKFRWHRHPNACRDYGYVHRYYGGAPLPYYGYWDWRRERRNWLWD
jgi:hypothetical protein